jgi:hypothetical protein
VSSLQIFAIQCALSLIVYGLLARWYIAPRLAVLPRHGALAALLIPHALRHFGMVFLVPAVVAPTLPPPFALPAAYGDLLTAWLALAAIVALRARWTPAIAPTWLANTVGTLDLCVALFQGARWQVGDHLGAAWYIPTSAVPLLLVTHGMIFARLLAPSPRALPAPRTTRPA